MLSQLWRGLGTAFFLSVIGLGGTLLSVTVFPAIVFCVREPNRRRRALQTTLHYLFRLYCSSINILGLADIKFTGLERLADLKGHLIIANHPSLLDVVMIMACVRDVQCVVKSKLWSHPFFGLTVRGAGFIRNDLPPEIMVEQCKQSLANGQNLIIFPEGTRTTPNQNPKPQRGFANLALFAMADILMIDISCDPPILFKGNPWWHVPIKKSRIRLNIGEIIPIAPYLAYEHRGIAARKLTEFVEQYYRKDKSCD